MEHIKNSEVFNLSDKEFLQWIHDHLQFLYKSDYEVDYLELVKLRTIINAIPDHQYNQIQDKAKVLQARYVDCEHEKLSDSEFLHTVHDFLEKAFNFNPESALMQRLINDKSYDLTMIDYITHITNRQPYSSYFHKESIEEVVRYVVDSSFRKAEEVVKITNNVKQILDDAIECDSSNPLKFAKHTKLMFDKQQAMVD